MAGEGCFCVGLNNYSHVINETGYARFIPLESDRGIVHNIYYLHASEMGWIGMIVFLLMIGNFLLMAVSRSRHSSRKTCPTMRPRVQKVVR